MSLDKNCNYIVSGLERSGTSMMMQILHAGGLPTAFDDLRKKDENNPKGYYELEGGKIINKLMEKTFPIKEYEGRFIKITAFGLTFLPEKQYKIIYMERNLDEIMDSMEKMARIQPAESSEIKESFRKLNEKVKNDMQNRDDIDVIFINYNNILSNPDENLKKLCDFLKLPDDLIIDMKGIIDSCLYRQRR